MVKEIYLIVDSASKTLYWNNLYGWCDFVFADIYDHDEMCVVALPIGGEWAKYVLSVEE